MPDIPATFEGCSGTDARGRIEEFNVIASIRRSLRQIAAALCLFVLVATAVSAQGIVGGLPRAGDLGFRPTQTPEGRIAVRALVDKAPVTAAGLRQGDVIDAINGAPVGSVREWFSARRAVKAGAAVRLRVLREGRSVELRFTADGVPLERNEGLDTVYTSVQTDAGFHVRLIVTRPRGAAGALPAILFIPWLSCSSVEYPRGPDDGWAHMLQMLMRESAVVLVRVEKAGVGDSSGPDCADADLASDMAGFRAAIRWAAQADGIDSRRLLLFGGSIGAALAPVLAAEFGDRIRWRGVMAAGGYAKTWLEHMLEVERRSLLLRAADPATIDRTMRGLADFYALYLNGRLTPAQVIERRPDLAPLWSDEPAHQYGRRAAYFHQVQALDVWAAWSRVSVPVLLVHGEYDHLMSAEDPQLVARMLNEKRAGQVTLLLAPKMDHHFDRYADAKAAFAEEGGSFDRATVEQMLVWVRQRLAKR